MSDGQQRENTDERLEGSGGVSAQERGESSEAREGTGEPAPGLDRGPQGAAGTRWVS